MLHSTASNVAVLRVPTLSPQHLIYACLPASQVLVRQSFRCYCEFRSNSLSVQNGHHHSHLQGQGEGPPLLPGSYRGITLTSVIAKTFEHLLDMLPVLSDNCTPHLNQTAYQHGVSSPDATFSCQETISKFIRDGDSVYSCFYDLASAFNTVEYPVLLSHLEKAGVSGEAWRLTKDWSLH